MSITIYIIILTVIVSLFAWQSEAKMNQLLFQPVRIWENKEWYRTLSNGFIHADFQHLLFNMLTLFFFGPTVEAYFTYLFPAFGNTLYILFYISALFVSGLPALFLQKNNYYYSALGASGAVSAVLYAAILFDPTAIIYIKFIIPVPAVLYGVFYLVLSAYMAKRGGDNIGHLAHFAGAVYGFIFPILLRPTILIDFFDKIKNSIG